MNECEGVNECVFVDFNISVKKQSVVRRYEQDDISNQIAEP